MAKAKAKKAAPAVAKKRSGDNSVACAVLSYLLIGIIWYFADDMMRKNKFVQTHVRQAIALLGCWFICALVLGVIPIIGWIILAVLNIVFLIFWILGIIHAATGKDEEMPLFGPIGDKIKV